MEYGPYSMMLSGSWLSAQDLRNSDKHRSRKSQWDGNAELRLTFDFDGSMV